MDREMLSGGGAPDVGAEVLTAANGHRAVGPRSPAAGQWGRADWFALASLVGMVIIVLWRLALTDLIIGRGDLFFYFYPYRDFASAAVRGGHVPLWNPYLFMGAPFLANSQAGVFYLPNLALAWLPVERMVNASIVLHVALAVTGAYLWGRARLGLWRPGAWLVGLCYGLGGYFLAQVEHLNQVQVLAWLPWLLWVYDWQTPLSAPPTRWRPWIGARIVGLSLLIAVQFLAGHMQSVFICLVGLAAYALLPLLWDAIRRRAALQDLLRPLGILLSASILGAALAAVQLLPTLELSRLSIRSGGLPYREAVSFSLRPELVGRALLPNWGAPLFPEFVAYVGLGGLGLAVVGAVAGARAVLGSPPRMPSDAQHDPVPRSVYLARRGALALALVGLFLALGGFNPAYFLLVKLVPGFGFFRAPARWLGLYALGAAGLAGVGLHTLFTAAEARMAPSGYAGQRRVVLAGWTISVGLLVVWALAGSQLVSDQDSDLAPPLELWAVVLWSLAALAFGVVLYIGSSSRSHRTPRVAITALIALVVLELLGASLFLPFNRATAPGALTSLRPAVAHLLGEAHAATPGPPDRFLSISDIFFDPGDKAEIESVYQPQISDDALYDYIIATKQKEVLIPNLPLYYRLPAMDGYDGGVLPLRRYVTLERLYMPEDKIAIDGRLREHMESLPDARWLSLFNVRYVITDKVRDAWFDDVFYDLQMGATLSHDDQASVGYVPLMPATALGIVYQAEGAIDGAIALFDVTFSDGEKVSIPLLADAVGTGDRVARLSWEQPRTPSAIDVRGAWGTGQVIIRGLSLIDERTGVFMPLVVSDSGRYRLVHSGDVKIYENLDVLPRAMYVPQAVTAGDDEAALAIMRDPGFDPTAAVVLVDVIPPSHQSQDTDTEHRMAEPANIELLLYEPEHIIATLTAPADGWLVLGDAWYPSWEATIDGEPVAMERANVLFRAVAVPAGEHRIEWFYRPTVYLLGMAISLGSLGLLLARGVWLVLHRLALGSKRRSSLSGRSR